MVVYKKKTVMSKVRWRKRNCINRQADNEHDTFVAL